MTFETEIRNSILEKNQINNNLNIWFLILRCDKKIIVLFNFQVIWWSSGRIWFFSCLGLQICISYISEIMMEKVVLLLQDFKKCTSTPFTTPPLTRWLLNTPPQNYKSSFSSMSFAKVSSRCPIRFPYLVAPTTTICLLVV